jgi:hypothetical protein
VSNRAGRRIHGAGSALYVGMAASHHAMWIVLLAGSILVFVDLARMRIDPLATVAASGLVALAGLSVATTYMPMGW